MVSTEYHIKAMERDLQNLYANSNDRGKVVRATFSNVADARLFYQKYLQFASRYLPDQCELLDIGCGTGWSSYLFAEQGHKTVGVDLNAGVFQPSPHRDLKLLEGSVLKLPFNNHSFDAVTSYQCLEHVPDPARALGEIRRVLRPGGVVVFVGPNLLSLGSPIRGLLYYSWQQRPWMRILFRSADMPNHPAGNTLPENIACLIFTLGALLRLSLDPGFQYRMREPDLRPPFHSDNDACWVTNPLEMTRALQSFGFDILADHDPVRPAILRHLASGMYIAAKLRL